MAQTAVNDMRMAGGTSTAPVFGYALVLDATGGTTAALSVTLKNVKFSGTGAGATATLTGRVQGSNDRGNWYPINSSVDVSFTVLGDAGQTKPGESKAKGVPVSGWLWVRVELKLTVDTTPTVDALLSATLNVN